MRAESLRRRADFKRAYSVGRRVRRDGVTVFVATRRGSAGSPRLGVAIPAAAGTAVERNRIRRRLRAAVARCAIPDGRDVVVRANGTVRTTPFRELVGALEDALREADAL